MTHTIRATKARTDLTPSVLVLILLFVIVYYCGYCMRTGYKSDFEHTDKRESLDLSLMMDFGETDEHFVVYDSVCKIPRISPYSPDPATLQAPDVICGTKLQCTKPLVSKRFDNTSNRYYLHINEEWKDLYLREESAGLTCCFREIKNEASDEKLIGTPCFIFQQDFFVSLDVIGAIVNCMQRGTKKIVFMDAFSFIHKRNFSGEWRNDSKIGVLLFGLDSLSQINFRRRMPKSYKYLKDNNHRWHEFLGFNKLGYDAFPNLMALLTGRQLQQQETAYACKRGGMLDDCPFLWQQVSNMGMPTAYAADSRDDNTETLRFQHSPTDYYLQPYMRAVERRLRTDTFYITPQYCLGPRLAGSYVLDYAADFAQTFAGVGGLGIFWVHSFSEQHVIPQMIDYALAKYLRLLKSTKILQNYVVILLSANGMLRSRLNNLDSGFYEERLPLLYISLPNAWKSSHTALFQALELNRNRLVSPLDLHETIQHALALGAGTTELHCTDCASCQSVLRPIKANRSCSDAGIDWLWCSCEPFVAKWCNSYASSLLLKALLRHMNDLLQQAGLLNGICGILSAHTLYGVYNSQEESDYYYVKFKTSLKNAEFEAALWYNKTAQKVLLDERKLNRLDHKDTDCVEQHSELLRKLCVCL
ncbi:PREDICTED: uncharacterized protein LOC108967869 [Bactrocera latifrons]|uniref:uncharacterized protein LOC108967869 n=1 Tax=Bactrocera latifrons TaxID=174628 RepID=UPI0008DD79B5|nr:PREDICTED: uncharacterized protein LOC108967869 [Bactrocera latifrons]